MRLYEEDHVAKRWFERTYPNMPDGPEAARLILAYGAGLDRGLAEAEEMLQDFIKATAGAA